MVGTMSPKATEMGEGAPSVSLEIGLCVAASFDIEETDAWRIVQEVPAATRSWLDRARARSEPVIFPLRADPAGCYRAIA